MKQRQKDAAFLVERILDLRRRLGRVIGAHIIEIVLGSLILSISYTNIRWNRENTAPMAHTVDPYAYLVRTLRFCDNLGEIQGATELVQEIRNLSHSGRPVLYQLLTVPLVLAFGRSEDVALYVNIIFECMLLVCTYCLGTLAQCRRLGLLAAIVVASYPPIIHLSHIYRPHAALPACVALSALLLSRVILDRSAKNALFLGASMCFGTMIHPKFLFVSLVPTAFFLAYSIIFGADPKRPSHLRNAPLWILNKLRQPFVLAGLLPGALALSVCAFAWLLTMQVSPVAMIEFIRQLLRLFSGAIHASGVFEHEPSFWWYVQTAPNAISVFFSILAVAGFILCFWNRGAVNWIVLFSVVVGYSVWSSYTSLTWWYFASVLPLVAVISTSWIGGLRSRWLSDSLIVVCLFMAFFNFSLVTWGAEVFGLSKANENKIGMVTGLFSCGRSAVFCSEPARSEYWPIPEIVDVIASDPRCQRGAPCRLSIDSHLSPYFRYYVTKNIPIFHVEMKSVKAPNAKSAHCNFSKLLGNDYLLIMFLRGYPGGLGDPLSPASAFVDFLNSPSSFFREAYRVVASYDTPDGRGAKLLKRVEPVTAEEIVVSRSMLLDRLEASRLTAKAIALPQQHRKLKIATLQDALEVCPDMTLARIEMARAYYQEARHNEAIALLREVTLSDSDDPRPYIILGRVYLSEARVDAAIKNFEKALEIDRHAIKAKIGMAQAYHGKGFHRDELSLYEEILEISPNHLNARKALFRHEQIHED